MEVARKLYRRAGVFWREARGEEPEQNPWGVKFQRMFDMSNDSALFRTLDDLQADGWELQGNIFLREDERYLPLYEAKLFHQYDHRFATFEGASEKDRKNGTARQMATSEKQDPNAVPLPRYWVPEAEVDRRLVPARAAGRPHSCGERERERETLLAFARSSLSGRSPEQRTNEPGSLA